MFVAEFQEDVRITIPAIAEHLKNSHSGIRKAAIEGVSRLAEQGMCSDLASLSGGRAQPCL